MSMNEGIEQKRELIASILNINEDGLINQIIQSLNSNQESLRQASEMGAELMNTADIMVSYLNNAESNSMLMRGLLLSNDICKEIIKKTRQDDETAWRVYIELKDYYDKRKMRKCRELLSECIKICGLEPIGRDILIYNDCFLQDPFVGNCRPKM